MTPGQLADAYLGALQAADEARVLALFTGDAIVPDRLVIAGAGEQGQRLGQQPGQAPEVS